MKPTFFEPAMAALLLCTSLPALAQVNWPNGPAPCDNSASLQLCIDSQADGAVIEINANSIALSNDIDVDQNLTIRAASGFTPVFEEPTSWVFENDSGPVSVAIEGLTFDRLEIEARQSDGDSTLDFAFRNNDVRDVFGRGIEIIGSGESGSEPIGFMIEENVIRAFEHDGNVVRVFSAWTTGNEGLVRNNRFESSDVNFGSVLNFNGPIGRLTDMTVDVIGNFFGGDSYSAGVIFRYEELGELNGRVINNVLLNQSGVGFIPMTLGVIAQNTSSEGEVWILNNTLVDNEQGIVVLTSDEPDVRTFIFNNVVASSAATNFLVDENSVVSNDYNLGFDAGLPDPFIPGPNFIEADPLFFTNTDPQLQAGSPAIDSGDSSVVPVDILTDFAGNDRIQGAGVDRGAYEFEFVLPESVPVPTLNAAGLIMLILICLVLGLVFGRRQDAVRNLEL